MVLAKQYTNVALPNLAFETMTIYKIQERAGRLGRNVQCTIRGEEITSDVIEGEGRVRDILDHGKRAQQAPLLQRLNLLPQL